jgi:acetylornithine/succinyldiaminopimelate/putrescine aminotransferase
MGLLAGVVTSTECADIVKGCMEKGVLLNCTAKNVVRFMPPLTVLEEEIDQAVDVLDGVLAGL